MSNNLIINFSGINGSDGSDGTKFVENSNDSFNGLDGENGQNGTDGTNGANIHVTIKDNGYTISVVGYAEINNTRTDINRSIKKSYDTKITFLSIGGAGGNGGNGHEGDNGHNGRGGTNASLYSYGRDGQDGGNGGFGGMGGKPGNGGHGGDIYITVSSSDEDLLKIIECKNNGGMAGEPGNHGKSGKPGKGGPGGSSYINTTQNTYYNYATNSNVSYPVSQINFSGFYGKNGLQTERKDVISAGYTGKAGKVKYIIQNGYQHTVHYENSVSKTFDEFNGLSAIVESFTVFGVGKQYFDYDVVGGIRIGDFEIRNTGIKSLSGNERLGVKIFINPGSHQIILNDTKSDTCNMSPNSICTLKQWYHFNPQDENILTYTISAAPYIESIDKYIPNTKVFSQIICFYRPVSIERILGSDTLYGGNIYKFKVVLKNTSQNDVRRLIKINYYVESESKVDVKLYDEKSIQINELNKKETKNIKIHLGIPNEIPNSTLTLHVNISLQPGSKEFKIIHTSKKVCKVRHITSQIKNNNNILLVTNKPTNNQNITNYTSACNMLGIQFLIHNIKYVFETLCFFDKCRAILFLDTYDFSEIQINDLYNFIVKCKGKIFFENGEQNLIDKILLSSINNKESTTMTKLFNKRDELYDYASQTQINDTNQSTTFILKPSNKIHLFTRPDDSTLKEYSQEAITNLKDIFPNSRYVSRFKPNFQFYNTFVFDYQKIRIKKTVDDSTYSVIITNNIKKHSDKISPVDAVGRIFMLLEYEEKLKILPRIDTELQTQCCNLICLDTILEFINLYKIKNKFKKITPTNINMYFTKLTTLTKQHNKFPNPNFAQIIENIYSMAHNMNTGCISPQYSLSKLISNHIKNILLEHNPKNNKMKVNMFEYVQQIYQRYHIMTDHSIIPEPIKKCQNENRYNDPNMNEISQYEDED